MNPARLAAFLDLPVSTVHLNLRSMNLTARQWQALERLAEHPEGVHFFPELHKQGVMRSSLRALERKGLVRMERDTTTFLTEAGEAVVKGEKLGDL